MPPPELAAAPPQTRIQAARVRRAMTGTWAAGCALVVLAALLSASTPGLSMAVLVLAGAFVLPISGLAGFCLVLYERSRAAVSSLVAAVFSLASAIALFGPAHRAGIEMHVAANQAALDALAAEIRAASVGVAVTPRGWAGGQIPLRFYGRLEPLGLRITGPVDGGLLFTHNGELGYSLLYADGAAGPPGTCRNVHLGFLGGRWYRYDCRDYAYD
jgi:hypothetical protein